jgi:UDP-N-acetylglucosamine acyltransferase
VGLQRAGMTEEQLSRVKQLYKIVFRSNLGLTEALAQVEQTLGGNPEVDHFVAFVKASQRGITR